MGGGGGNGTCGIPEKNREYLRPFLAQEKFKSFKISKTGGAK